MPYNVYMRDVMSVTSARLKRDVRIVTDEVGDPSRLSVADTRTTTSRPREGVLRELACLIVPHSSGCEALDAARHALRELTLPMRASCGCSLSDGPTPDHVEIDDAQFLFTAHFKKSGPDLILTGDNGQKLVLVDYFNLANARI